MSAFADTSTPDPSVQTITLPDGGERVVFRQGVGRPLLLIQGLSGTHDQWGDELIASLVEAGRAIVVVNHRGVYRTAVPVAGYTIADMADDQIAALDVLGLTGPVDIFGISMGGMIAQELTLRHPERVRTLALGCTTAGGAHMVQPAMEDLAPMFTAQQAGDRAAAVRAGFEINLSQKFWDNDEVYARFVEQAAIAPVPMEVIFSQMQAIGGHDTFDRLKDITVPVAILHGTEDKMLPYPNQIPIHEAIAGSTLDTFEGAGHMFFYEEGARTAGILETLSKRSSEASASITA
jgi:3-oxoadipate enol-lactonase